MFNTAILDVVIGMVFVYLLLSLMCSAGNELVELWLKNRAVDLERGLRELLQDPTGKGLVNKIYNHPLIKGLFEGSYDPNALGKAKRALGRVKLPSYIPARTFVLALLDTALQNIPTTASGTVASTPSSTTPASSSTDAFAALRNSISGLREPEVEQALRSLVDAADNDVARARANIENWFDAKMDRVAGFYKRRSQVFVLIIGLFVTIAVNADSVLIAKRLSADKSMRESLVSAAQEYARVNANPAPNTNAKSGESNQDRTEQMRPAPSPSVSPSSSPNPGSSPSPARTTTATAPSPTPTVSPIKTREAENLNQNGKTDCKQTPDTPQCKYLDSLEQIKSLALPIGWDSAVDGQKWPGLHPWEEKFWSEWYVQFRVHALGWLLTVLAISLGAPFWFDLLNKFIVVRSTVKPREKSPEEKPK